MGQPVLVWAAAPVYPPLPCSVATVVVKGVLECKCCHAVISVVVVTVC